MRCTVSSEGACAANYHTPNDTVDTLDIGFMANSTMATIAGLAALATLDVDSDGTPDTCA